MTDAVAKSSSLANHELVNECHLIGGIDNVGRVEQIYVEAKETFWKKKKKKRDQKLYHFPVGIQSSVFSEILLAKPQRSRGKIESPVAPSAQ